jgi:hypothetical protein
MVLLSDRIQFALRKCVLLISFLSISHVLLPYALLGLIIVHAFVKELHGFGFTLAAGLHCADRLNGG